MTKYSIKKTALILLGFGLLMPLSQSVIAAEYPDLISEEYLRASLSFEPGDELKFAECKKNSYPTCTYVWGTGSEKDAARKKYGLAPDGNKLQIVYAQAKSLKDFNRVLGTYQDAVNVDNLAAQAVWSEKRNQLSLITDEDLIIHVNVAGIGGGVSKEEAVSIARHLLEQL